MIKWDNNGETSRISGFRWEDGIYAQTKQIDNLYTNTHTHTSIHTYSYEYVINILFIWNYYIYIIPGIYSGLRVYGIQRLWTSGSKSLSEKFYFNLTNIASEVC